MDEYTFPIILLIAGFFFGIVLLILNEHNTDNSWKKTTKTTLSKLDGFARSNDINTLKTLLMDADKLLDFCLEKSGVKGDKMGDRLKNVKDKIVGKEIKKGQRVSQSEWKKHKKKKELYNKIWEAHKLRNKLAHEINFNPTKSELKTGYTSLKRGIKSLL